MNQRRVFDEVAELHDAAAAFIRDAAAHAIAQRGQFLLVLAGGTTPRGVYERLAARFASEIDWQRVHLFWGDERCVPPDQAHSNYRMAAEALLQHVAVPAGHLHRIPGEKPAERAAAEYDQQLREFFQLQEPGELPTGHHAFDLVLLGLGDDGHTASLFPDSPALEANSWAALAKAPPAFAVPDRVTLTFPALNSARDCLFLVTGAAKRETVRRVLRSPAGERDTQLPLPAARVRPRGRTFWFLDRAAAGK
jgi:6-phosphogluconolactonase